MPRNSLNPEYALELRFETGNSNDIMGFGEKS